MSALSARPTGLLFGGPARVDLLPDEVRAQRRGRSVRVGAIVAAVIALVLSAGAYAGSSTLVASAQSNLQAEQAGAQQLLLEQQKYIEVSHVQSQLTAITAAQQIATSADIDWPGYLAELRGALPGSAQITAVTDDGVTPIAGFGQPTAPLSSAQIGTMVVTLSSPSLAEEANWVRSIDAIPGVVGAMPTSATITDGQYVISITVALGRDAIHPRFPTKGAAK